MGTTPDLTRRNAEDTLLYSFPSSLTMPTLPTPNPLKYSHSSFEVCCWLRVRADDLPKITQCGEKKNILKSETCTCGSLEAESAVYLRRCCQGKRCLLQRTRNHRPLSHTVLFFQNASGGVGVGGGWGVEFHKLISFVETVGVDIFLCIYLTNSRSSLAHRSI